MIEHPYERGPYGRCAAKLRTGVTCNKRKAAHTVEPPVMLLPRAEWPSPTPDGSIDATSFTGPGSLAVTLRVRHKRGDLLDRSPRTDERDIDWPVEWPLPSIGQVVRGAETGVASVRGVTFDLDRKRVILDCE